MIVLDDDARYRLYYLVHEILREKKYVVIADIVDRIKRVDEIPNMSASTLLKVVKALGFRWKRVTRSIMHLQDDPRLVAWRKKYLKQLREYIDQGYNIAYTDETWVNYSLKVTQNKQTSGVQP